MRQAYTEEALHALIVSGAAREFLARRALAARAVAA